METTPTNKPDFWFPAKTYGWGWGIPCTWQGWAVFIGYIVGITLTAFLANPVDHPVLYYITCGVLTLVLIAICWLKGEKAAWRWGKNDTPKD